MADTITPEAAVTKPHTNGTEKSEQPIIKIDAIPAATHTLNGNGHKNGEVTHSAVHQPAHEKAQIDKARQTIAQSTMSQSEIAAKVDYALRERPVAADVHAQVQDRIHTVANEVLSWRNQLQMKNFYPEDAQMFLDRYLLNHQYEESNGYIEINGVHVSREELEKYIVKRAKVTAVKEAPPLPSAAEFVPKTPEQVLAMEILGLSGQDQSVAIDAATAQRLIRNYMNDHKTRVSEDYFYVGESRLRQSELEKQLLAIANRNIKKPGIFQNLASRARSLFRR